MSRLAVLLLAAGCAESAGLEELASVPADFPLALEGETGKITRSAGAGQVSVDLIFETGEEAAQMMASLKAQALGKPWTAQEPLPGKRRWEVDAYQLPDSGRVELGCCPTRADRRHLVLVTWWPPAAAK